MRLELRRWTWITVLSISCVGNLNDNDAADQSPGAALSTDGVFTLAAVHSDKCVDVNGASKADGANVQQWTCNGGANQEWELSPLGNGLHQVVSTNSGKCLDVLNASKDNGANVQQWKCGTGDNQKWELLSAGGDEYQLRAVHSKKCLDVSKAGSTDGANIQQWTCSDVPQQKFRLTRVDGGGGPQRPSFCNGVVPPTRAGQWQSAKVQMDDKGALSYPSDTEHNRIVDFSYAGYHSGEQALPEVAVVSTLGPAAGDNTKRIQDALDAIGKRTPDANGIRGALLLSPGHYDIQGTLHINQGGVVLRGSGSGTDESANTVLFGKGDTPHQRTLVVVGSGSGSPWKSGAKVDVTDAFVQVGAQQLNVADASQFKAGQEVIINHPSSQKWIDALGGGGMKKGAWAAGSKDIPYVRRIVRISGSTLFLDAPVFNHLDRALTQATVAPVTSRSLIAEAGLENLRVDIENKGGKDENHVWDAVSVSGAENSWVRGLSVVHFGHAAVATHGSIRITVANVSATEPVAIRTGGRMYNFDAEGFSQLILFTHCEAKDGRHNFISNGTMSASGVVWHRCTSSGASNSEGHRHWSQALLFDAIDAKSGVIGLINRGDWGTQHGWGSAHSVIWNYNQTMHAQKPPTAQNYAISRSGSFSTKTPFPGPSGFSEIKSGELVPESLYEAQLCARLH